VHSTFPALRMTIHLHGSEHWRHRPLAAEIIHRAHRFGLAGASVFHGFQGFGASSVVHTVGLMSVGDLAPIVIVIVDVPEKITAFLPELGGLIEHGMLTLDDVTAVRYHPDTQPRS
jgi:PII-like signaling protein